MTDATTLIHSLRTHAQTWDDQGLMAKAADLIAQRDLARGGGKLVIIDYGPGDEHHRHRLTGVGRQREGHAGNTNTAI